jgi:hypothetical protein
MKYNIKKISVHNDPLNINQFVIFAVTDDGDILSKHGNSHWIDITPNKPKEKLIPDRCPTEFGGLA